MKAIQNLLEVLNEHWTSLLICAGLIVGLVSKAIRFFNQSKDIRIAITKQQISEIILKMITDAEVNYKDWEKSGSIKRSQVINEIYAKYPILSKAKSQKEVIDFIDTQIDNSLNELRKIIVENINLGNIKE